jgi:hypothetical protein
MKSQSFRYLFVAAMVLLVGCDDFLDRTPKSSVTPADYLFQEADLAAFTLARYGFPTHGGWNMGTFDHDAHTDNQARGASVTRWVPGEWRVPSSGGSWAFGAIYQINYFLDQVEPRHASGDLIGNTANIEHYIGEAYFLRAFEYFNRLQALGDFPIITEPLPDDMDRLIAESVRRPRHEVARFILSDLDKAIGMLQNSPPGGKNRISRWSALLFKSRVALFEGTWLEYHKNTAHVPGGPGYPGGSVSINIDAEIDFFLGQAMAAAAEVADAVPLTPNNFTGSYISEGNPYYDMFSSVDLEPFEEVLFWRAYNRAENVTHNLQRYVAPNANNNGYTRGYVDNFVMENGLPIYDPASGYHGDDWLGQLDADGDPIPDVDGTLNTVKRDRDQRLRLFMKGVGEVTWTNHFIDGEYRHEPAPFVFSPSESRMATGYAIKKGMSYDVNQWNAGDIGEVGSIVFRAVEAYLNYIEASYLRTGALDAKATGYWQAIRTRAGIEPDFMVTVNATVMAEEAKNDFAAYSAGQLLTDPVLYNIRRERRSELMAEGHRMRDLRRWRALDQLMTTPYNIEGFKIWGPMQDWFDGALIRPEDPGTATVSSPNDSEYYQIYRVNLSASNHWRDGYRWAKAHYLDPIAINHFSITAGGDNGDAGEDRLRNSPIYQNPYWPLQANAGALE